MKQIETNKDLNDDVLVMFPASKNFPVEGEKAAPTPLNKLIEEFEEQIANKENKRPVMAIPAKESIASIRGKSSCAIALEVRLKALEEIEQRLKFYLDDIGTAKKRV